MDDHFDLSDTSAGAPSGIEPAAGEMRETSDGPPDEVEVGTAVKEEIERFAHHPRREVSRLRQVEEEGESGVTPFLYLFTDLKLILPAAALMAAALVIAVVLLGHLG